MVDNSTTVSYTRRAKKRGVNPLFYVAKITQKNNQKDKKVLTGILKGCII